MSDEFGVTLLWMGSDSTNRSRLVRVFKTSEEANRMPLCWRSHLGTKSLPGSTQGLRLNCVLSKNMFAMRGPNEVIRSTTRGTGSSTGHLGAATVATAIRSTTAGLMGGPVQNCKSSSRPWKR